MGSIKDFMNAASSSRDSVSDTVSYTNVDLDEEKRRIIDTIRWTYSLYYGYFECMNLQQASKVVTAVRNDGSVYKQFSKSFGECKSADVATIDMSLVWTGMYVITGIRHMIRMCYLDTPANVSEEDFTNVHVGKKWNSFLIVGTTDELKTVPVRIDGGDESVDLDVINIGTDTYEVLLTTQKER